MEGGVFEGVVAAEDDAGDEIVWSDVDVELIVFCNSFILKDYDTTRIIWANSS